MASSRRQLMFASIRHCGTAVLLYCLGRVCIHLCTECVDVCVCCSCVSPTCQPALSPITDAAVFSEIGLIAVYIEPCMCVCACARTWIFLMSCQDPFPPHAIRWVSVAFHWRPAKLLSKVPACRSGLTVHPWEGRILKVVFAWRQSKPTGQ